MTARASAKGSQPWLRRWIRSGGPSAFAFIVPTILIFGMFSWWPIIRGVVMSLQRTNLVTTEWVGVENFQRVLADPLTWIALQNTFWYMVLSLLLGFAVPLLLATLIAEMRRSRGLASLLVFLPVVIPPIVSILLWKFFYSPGENGLFNIILGFFGLSSVGWLQTPLIAMPAIVVQLTWATFGSATIIYLAALAGVDVQLYEAAEIDGAPILRRFWHVTLPHLRSLLLLMLLLQIIGVFQIFTEPYLMTDGGPNNATLSLMLLIFRHAFVFGDFGTATALSVLLAGMLAVISVIYLRLTRSWRTS